MTQQSQKKLRKATGILQIIFSLPMILYGLIGSPLAIMNRLGHACTRAPVLMVIYLIVNVLIGGFLRFLGEKMTGAYIITDEVQEISKDRGKWKEILMIVLNAVHIVLCLSTNAVIYRSVKALLFSFLLLTPEIVLIILASILLRAKMQRVALKKE